MFERNIERCAIHSSLSAGNYFKDVDVTVAAEISPANFLDLHSVYRRSGSDFSIACRNDIRSFDHKNDGAFRRARAMSNPFWNNKNLTRPKIDNLVLTADAEMP